MNYCLNFHFINHFFVIPLSLLTSLLGNGSPVINCTDSQTVPIFTEISLVRVNAPIEPPENIPRTFLQVGKGDLCSRGALSHPWGRTACRWKILSLFQLTSASRRIRRQFYSPSAAAHELKAGKHPLHVFLSFGSTTKWNYNRFQPRQVLQHIYIVAVRGKRPINVENCGILISRSQVEDVPWFSRWLCATTWCVHSWVWMKKLVLKYMKCKDFLFRGVWNRTKTMNWCRILIKFSLKCKVQC